MSRPLFGFSSLFEFLTFDEKFPAFNLGDTFRLLSSQTLSFKTSAKEIEFFAHDTSVDWGNDEKSCQWISRYTFSLNLKLFSIIIDTSKNQSLSEIRQIPL